MSRGCSQWSSFRGPGGRAGGLRPAAIRRETLACRGGPAFGRSCRKGGNGGPVGCGFGRVFPAKLQFEVVACRGGPALGFSGFPGPAGWWVPAGPGKPGSLAPTDASGSLNRSKPAQPAPPAFTSSGESRALAGRPPGV